MAMRDPNPLVAGQGAARLAAAGIEVVFGPCEGEARELNIGFVSRMERGRPWLRLKAAVSLDGRSALDNGVSQWITGEAARTDGHAWRKRAGALLTGVGTVLDDDPRLDVRLVPTARQPLRVIVDSRLQTPPSARILAAPGSVLLYAAIDDAAKRRELEARGVEVALLPSPGGKVDLAAMLADLGGRGINELHVEAGEKLNASLLKEGAVDELLVYVAPRLLGSGRGLAALGPFEHAGAEPRLPHRRRRAGRRRPAICGFAVADAFATPRPLRRGDNRTMFTGIVSGVGRIVEVEAARRRRGLRQGASRSRRRRAFSTTSRLGDSIALSGACMTVVRLEPAAAPLPCRDLGRKPGQDRRPRRRRRSQSRKGDARQRPARRPSRVRPCRRRRPGHALRARRRIVGARGRGAGVAGTLSRGQGLGRGRRRQPHRQHASKTALPAARSAST